LFLKYFNHYSEPSMQRRWIEKFAAYGIDESRLILKAKIDNRPDHLDLYSNIDIALDPFPFNGATTTIEALSMGVPVVTLLGRHFVDRVAASMVSHAGMPELVADDRAAYVDLARNLASDPNRLADMRRTMRHQVQTSPLCRGADYARTIEDAFRDMWRTWCETGGYRGR
jgi:predicted O-linked N-acetylglucosamine transferase (SPINDLY family)